VTVIHHEADASLDALAGQRIAVVGYGNQGRSWALNLRDSGLDVRVHARADDSRRQAVDDGFDAGDIPGASDADVLCLLVPDDIIPILDIVPRDDALVVVASGYSVAYERFIPSCDIGMVAPRMLGPEVRECYLEDVGFITAVGVQQDVTGTARDRTLAVALAIGGLKQGAIEMTPMQEAVLDLAVEQALAPALRRVNLAFTQVMAEHGIPLEAILAELFLSGEMERTFRRLRLEGYAAQMEHHSPISQYGQLSRVDRYDAIDLLEPMRSIVTEIADGRFADEWDAEREEGHPTLQKLKDVAVGPEVVAWEKELRATLGEAAARGSA
jgi:ketol-acid reductoisomerase